MLQALIQWLSGNTDNNSPRFRRIAVYRIEKAYLTYKSKQRIHKFIEANIEIYKNRICKKFIKPVFPAHKH